VNNSDLPVVTQLPAWALRRKQITQQTGPLELLFPHAQDFQLSAWARKARKTQPKKIRKEEIFLGGKIYKIKITAIDTRGG
jgi:hypothetical protein